MIKILSIIIIAFFFSTQDASTQSTITIGDSYDDVKGKEKYYFDMGDFIYTVKIKDNASVFAQKIEKSSLKETNKKLHTNLFSKEAQTLNVVYGNKQFYIFTIVETARRKFAIHGTIINQEDLSVEMNNVKLLDLNEGIHRPYYQKLAFIFQSPDKSKILVKYYKPLPRKDSPDGITMGLYVYDTDLEKIGGGEIEMPFSFSEMDEMGASIDNDGTINIAGYNLVEDAYHLVKFSPKDLSHEIISTANKNFNYHNDFALNGTKNKYVAGFYDNEGAMQMYFIDLENSKEFAITVPEDIVPYYKDRGKRKNTLMVHEASVQDDGGLLVIAQELYGIAMSSSWNTGGGRSNTSMSSMMFNDFFLVRTNRDGTLKWIKRIDKEKKLEMSSAGDITANSPNLKYYKFYPRERYYILSKAGKHYFIFEDDKKEDKGKAIYICNIDDETGASAVHYGFGYGRVGKTKINQANVKKTMVLGENRIGAEVFIKREGDTLLRDIHEYIKRLIYSKIRVYL